MMPLDMKNAAKMKRKKLGDERAHGIPTEQQTNHRLQSDQELQQQNKELQHPNKQRKFQDGNLTRNSSSLISSTALQV